MKFVFRTIATVLIVCFVCIDARRKRSKDSDKSSNVQQDTELLQEAVRNLLGFKDLPQSESGRMIDVEDRKMAPKYMLDLYEKFKSGDIQQDNADANTVRSIHSQIGE